MSRRTVRIGSLIRQIIAEAIRTHLSDPRIPTITSILRVEVSEDLSVAKVFVSVLGTDTQRKLAVEALQCAAGRLRRLLAPELSLRKVPQLVFESDTSVQVTFDTISAIDDAMRDLGQLPVWEAEDADTGTDGGPASDDPLVGADETDASGLPLRPGGVPAPAPRSVGRVDAGKEDV
ncbi:MAG: 30S ribosome-binding factor RbfA [Phycisphaerales bacterium]|nr:30S ribosome-binding factor RbfA [Phycisphaerales bacterium]